MKTIFVLLPVLLIFSISSSAQSEEEKVKQTLIDMWAAIEAEDIEKYASFIHDDFTAFGEYDTYLTEGKDLEIAGVTDWISRYDDIKTNMHQPQVTINGEVAWIIYYWTDSSISAEGTRSTSRGKSTRIFVKENGEWLCIHGHYTAVP
ncbi:MAG: nuclear transport factor 2 family protein [Cyclobacteriaceae bacterium]